MRIDLPSGAWVECKDNTVPGDRFAVQDAVEVVVGEDRQTHIVGAASAQWKAFLTRIITAWSYEGVPIPAVGGSQVLDEYPQTDDDIDALDDALAGRFERIVRSRRPNQNRPRSGTSGPSPS